METADVKKVLLGLGVGAGVITALTLTIIGIMAYRNYFEIKLTKLQIQKLENDIILTK